MDRAHGRELRRSLPGRPRRSSHGVHPRQALPLRWRRVGQVAPVMAGQDQRHPRLRPSYLTSTPQRSFALWYGKLTIPLRPVTRTWIKPQMKDNVLPDTCTFTSIFSVGLFMFACFGQSMRQVPLPPNGFPTQSSRCVDRLWIDGAAVHGERSRLRPGYDRNGVATSTARRPGAASLARHVRAVLVFSQASPGAGTYLRPMLSGCARASATVVGDRVYFMGGNCAGLLVDHNFCALAFPPFLKQ